MGQAAAARPSARNARYTQLYDEVRTVRLTP